MNQKWYINDEGIKVKPCGKCGKDFPCIEEYYSIKPNGNCYAYCHNCKKETDKEYRIAHRKTNKKWVKNPVLVRDGISYKKCTSCNIEYPFTKEFYDTQLNGQNGLKSTCKKCRKNSNRVLMGKKWAWHLLKNAQGSAKHNGLEINIDEQYILDLYKTQEGKCYWLGIEMTPSPTPKSLSQPSLDRLDRTKGYVRGNLVLCSFFANFGRNENEVSDWKRFLVSMEQNLNLEMWK